MTEIKLVTIEQAREALDDMDDYARMDAGVDAKGPREVLERFIAERERVMMELQELSASLKADAVALRRNGTWEMISRSYEHAAARIDTTLREIEAQEDAGAVEAKEKAKAWLLDVMGTWDFTMPTGAFIKIVNHLTALESAREDAEAQSTITTLRNRLEDKKLDENHGVESMEKQTPLIDLLERVPRDAVLVVEHDQFSSSSHPVGRLCHEAAAALRAALAEVERLRAEVERLNQILGRIVDGDGDSTLTIHTDADAFAAVREYLSTPKLTKQENSND